MPMSRVRVTRLSSRDGRAELATFDNITGFALARDGALVIADSGRVRRLTPDGVVATEAQGLITNSTKGLTTLPGLWGREQGVATDPQGNAVIGNEDVAQLVKQSGVDAVIIGNAA